MDSCSRANSISGPPSFKSRFSAVDLIPLGYLDRCRPVGVRCDYFTLFDHRLWRDLPVWWPRAGSDSPAGPWASWASPFPRFFGIPVRTESDFYYLALILLAHHLRLSGHLWSNPGWAGPSWPFARTNWRPSPWASTRPSIYHHGLLHRVHFRGRGPEVFLAVYQTTITPSNFRLEESCLDDHHGHCGAAWETSGPPWPGSWS